MIYTYRLQSRNKDNQGVDGFKVRIRTINTYSSMPDDDIIKALESFCQKGVPGETVRLYGAINGASHQKVTNSLIAHLALHGDTCDLSRIDSIVTSLADNAGNKVEKKWLFDIDTRDHEVLSQIVTDIAALSDISRSDMVLYDTPNGYGLIVPRGFDSRPLAERYDKDVLTLHRNGHRYITSRTKSL